MKNTIIVLALFMTTILACKKDDDNQPDGKAESDAIANAILGKKYKISAIRTVEGNTDARGEFPACILDDSYFIRSAGTVQIVQGAQLCGTHAQDTVNASWGFGYADNGGLKSLFFSLYTGGDTYKEMEFIKGDFTVNTSNGQEITLVVSKASIKYNFYLVKI
ncbi:hypothetical protein [Chitinophaga tropicalis]|uniref:Lipocalin-like domain-containing protein n=1 Tax=Chitinophaga tropicalis TaxID=2683588 RepID=A0A7K1UDQ3_9BACT|nr:hypothetical protein [Chitinophaga tropicalis]MVT12517.1 hypothetical protein [Chitinophaga tropicalis]